MEKLRSTPLIATFHGFPTLLRESRRQLSNPLDTVFSLTVMCCGSRIREPHTVSTPGAALLHVGEWVSMAVSVSYAIRRQEPGEGNKDDTAVLMAVALGQLDTLFR